MPIFLYIVTLVGLALVVVWLKDKFSRALLRRKNPPEKIAAQQRALESRKLNPDWAYYERHLQRPVPTALKELYANRALLLAPGLDYQDNYVINSFEPIDAQALVDSEVWLGFQVIPVATDDLGDMIYLRPGPGEPDRLYITHHDGGETEVFAESVTELVKELKARNFRQSSAT